MRGSDLDWSYTSGPGLRVPDGVKLHHDGLPLSDRTIPLIIANRRLPHTSHGQTVRTRKEAFQQLSRSPELGPLTPGLTGARHAMWAQRREVLPNTAASRHSGCALPPSLRAR